MYSQVIQPGGREFKLFFDLLTFDSGKIHKEFPNRRPS